MGMFLTVYIPMDISLLPIAQNRNMAENGSLITIFFIPEVNLYAAPMPILWEAYCGSATNFGQWCQ